MNNKPNITYLIGAGASANALPLVKDIFSGENGEIEKEGIARKMKKLSLQIQDAIKCSDSELRDFLIDMQNQLEVLSTKSVEFGTPDTFAKYIYLKDKYGKQYKDIKKALSFYFVIEQIVNREFDYRYLTFLVSLLDRDLTFPNRVKILSWNYDFQFQLASYHFRKESVSYEKQIVQQLEPLFDYIPQTGPNNSNLAKSLIHLNGIAGITKSEKGGLTRNFSVFLKDEIETDTTDRIISLSKRFMEISDNGENLLCFAWDRDIYDIKSYITDISDNTDVLVIIGYSFPYFNRTYDNRIFDRLKGKEGKVKIYYQDPYSDGSFLRSQFDLTEDKFEIEHHSTVENFLLPKEL